MLNAVVAFDSKNCLRHHHFQKSWLGGTIAHWISFFATLNGRMKYFLCFSFSSCAFFCSTVCLIRTPKLCTISQINVHLMLNTTRSFACSLVRVSWWFALHSLVAYNFISFAARLLMTMSEIVNYVPVRKYIISKSKVESPKVPTTTVTTTRKIIQYLWYKLYLKKKFSAIAVAVVVLIIIFRFLSFFFTLVCRAYVSTSFAISKGFLSLFLTHSLGTIAAVVATAAAIPFIYL